MKLTTTFWSNDVCEYESILFVNSQTNEIKFRANLNNKLEVVLFFKKIAKFVKTKEARRGNEMSANACYQFAVLEGSDVCPLKWFDLVVNKNVVLSHDIAFSTTLVKKNGFHVPFGRFPFIVQENKRLPKYREFNIKSKAYKFLANQIWKNWV